MKVKSLKERFEEHGWNWVPDRDWVESYVRSQYYIEVAKDEGEEINGSLSDNPSEALQVAMIYLEYDRDVMANLNNA